MITIPHVMSFSGGMKLLDMIPTGYNIAYVNSLLNTLGEKGRNAYLFNQIPLDMIYPLLFGISYCLIIAYFLKKIGKLESFLFYICFLPLFSGLFDYCENIGIIAMLSDQLASHHHVGSGSTQVQCLPRILTVASQELYFDRGREFLVLAQRVR